MFWFNYSCFHNWGKANFINVTLKWTITAQCTTHEQFANNLLSLFGLNGIHWFKSIYCRTTCIYLSPYSSHTFLGKLTLSFFDTFHSNHKYFLSINTLEYLWTWAKKITVIASEYVQPLLIYSRTVSWTWHWLRTTRWDSNFHPLGCIKFVLPKVIFISQVRIGMQITSVTSKNIPSLESILVTMDMA